MSGRRIWPERRWIGAGFLFPQHCSQVAQLLGDLIINIVKYLEFGRKKTKNELKSDRRGDGLDPDSSSHSIADGRSHYQHCKGRSGFLKELIFRIWINKEWIKIWPERRRIGAALQSGCRPPSVPFLLRTSGISQPSNIAVKLASWKIGEPALSQRERASTLSLEWNTRRGWNLGDWWAG